MGIGKGTLAALVVLSCVAGVARAEATAKEKEFKAPQWPVIGGVDGKVEVKTGKPETTVPAKKGLVLREKGLFTSEAGAVARIDLSPTDSIFVYPNTRFDLLAIDFEKGSVEGMSLHSGKIRVVIGSDAVRMFQSPLHADNLSRGDYLFEMLPKEANLKVEVLRGSLSFRGLEGERYEPLQEKDSTYFQGVLENGEIAYDILMHGKKIARGNIGKITRLKDGDIKQCLAPLSTLEKTYVIPKSKLPPPPDPRLICKDPGARFDQCSWVCVGGADGAKKCAPGGGRKCVRKRCSAQGQWVEAYELRAQEWKCESQPIIAKCDY